MSILPMVPLWSEKVPIRDGGMKSKQAASRGYRHLTFKLSMRKSQVSHRTIGPSVSSQVLEVIAMKHENISSNECLHGNTVLPCRHYHFRA